MPENPADNGVETLTNRQLLEEIAGELRELAALRTELAPLLALVRSTNGGTVGLARAARRMRGGT